MRPMRGAESRLSSIRLRERDCKTHSQDTFIDRMAKKNSGMVPAKFLELMSGSKFTPKNIITRIEVSAQELFKSEYYNSVTIIF